MSDGTTCLTCCCLCGVWILNHTKSPPWMREFHTVYATSLEADAKVHLSESGRRKPLVDVIDVAPSEHASRSKKTMVADFIPEFSDGGPNQWASASTLPPEAWGYPFHSACWKILTAFRSLEPGDLQALRNICRSVPKRRGMTDWGNSYGNGAVDDTLDWPQAPGEECLWSYPSPFVMAESDPCDIVEFRQILESPPSQALRTADDKVGRLPKMNPATDMDPFAKLPTEILLGLADRLPVRDVLNLRLASRAHANIDLPDAFWRLRFHPGREFEIAFEAIEYASSQQGNWRCIYKSFQNLFARPDLPASYLNRERIWKSCHLLHHVLAAVRNVSCDGIPVQSYFEPHMPMDERSWVMASRNLKLPAYMMNMGSRVIYNRVLALPAAVSAVYASTVEFFGRRYVSGIRLQNKDGESFSLGYRHPDTETLMDSREGLRIVGFDLAHDQRGVRGLALVSDTGKRSDWVGEFQGFPKRMLRSALPAVHIVDCLKGGFDAIKLVTLSVNAATQVPGLPSIPQTFEMQTVWYPDIPQLGLRFLEVENALSERRRSFRGKMEDLPLSFKLFGGSNAEHVDKLTAVTVRVRLRGGIDGRLGMIEAIAMSSTHNQDAAKVGIWCKEYDSEQTFTIDGPGGERIESITRFMKNGERGKLIGFTMQTNHGRVAEFFGGLSIQEINEFQNMHRILVDPEGKKVVGFWGTLESGHRFYDMGLVVH
ncbi:hypothetical protein F66182_5049 [Fusarium sp. NRRL 66182]|nr:hypothetical protein F66182_5049 [Fusarium sp. NRRL 66182]